MKRFWDKVDKSGDCWEWTGAKSCGYGNSWNDGKHIGAHRLVLHIMGIDIPAGMYVCHRCDNRGCVNPDHLFIGTPKDNMRDKIDKGRDRYSPRKGEKNGNSKLSEGNVKEILLSDESNATLAKRFDISRQLAWKIRTKQVWSHVS